MKKTKVIIAVCSFLVLVLVIAGLTLYAIGRAKHTDKKIYETNWNLSLPDGMIESYGVATEDNAMGDGLRYTVYVLNEKAASYFENLTDNQAGMPEEEIRKLLHMVHAAPQTYPNFTYDLCFKSLSQQDGSRLFILYDPKAYKAYFLAIHM